MAEPNMHPSSDRTPEETTEEFLTSPRSSSKRKLDIDETGSQSSQTGRSLPSTQTRFTSEDSDEPPRAAKRRSLHRENKTVAKGGVTGILKRPAQATFAEMYTFKAKNSPKTPANGVIDLTASKSPASTPPRNGTQMLSAFNPHQGPKRLVVKNIRPVKKEDNHAFFERRWKELDLALTSLFADGGAKLLLEELYQCAEHICRQGQPQELHKRLRQKCTTHLDDNLRAPLASQVTELQAVEFVEAFVGTWRLWLKQLQTIRHIFFYLNQTYLVKSGDDPDLDTMGLSLFRSILFQDARIKKAILDGTIELVQQDRKGQGSAVSTKLVKDSIVVFHDLGVYVSDFEPALIQSSNTFFASWRTTEAESSDLAHYVRSCSSLIRNEMSRCDSLSMDRTTRMELSHTIDQILIEENVDRLTEEDSLLDFFEGDMTQELEQVYVLLKRKGHEQQISPALGKFVETEGSLIVFDEKKESEMVVRLLEFKRKLDHIGKSCFQNSEFLGNALHKSFEVFMNRTKKSRSNWDTDNAKPGEMIAKHVDLLLKGGPKAVPGLRKVDKENAEEDNDYDGQGDDDTEVEKHLDDALDLFRFVHGKAVFEAFYKKDLARRLLMGRTQSFDAERSMLTRLRNECGAGFTHNLESMFKDMELAREEMKSYNQLLSDRGVRPSVDIAVNVLSVAAWPTYSDIPVNIPTSIAKAQSDFEQHYKTKHVGRKLTYKPSLAHCQLRSRFPRGNKEVVVSAFQALVLLLFNDVPSGGSLSYSEIKSATNLPGNELVRTLQSLACAKYRVLTKSPKGRDVNETDTFMFNSTFSDPKMRIKINQIQLKETKEENKETHQRVAADRHYETQAAIVRIMKARKRIGHNELIVEVIKATRSRGVLDQTDIKRNIEKLIEKDYMERDEEVKGYSYLA